MNHNRTYIRGIQRMAFNDKTVHTHVYYCLFTITRNLIPKTFDYICDFIEMRIILVMGTMTVTTTTRKMQQKSKLHCIHCLAPLWTSIPSYEISITIFVYIYIYTTNIRIENITTIIIITIILIITITMIIIIIKYVHYVYYYDYYQ